MAKPHLFDGTLLQVFLQGLLDEEFPLVQLQTGVILCDVFQDGHVGHPSALTARLQKENTES